MKNTYIVKRILEEQVILNGIVLSITSFVIFFLQEILQKGYELDVNKNYIKLIYIPVIALIYNRNKQYTTYKSLLFFIMRCSIISCIMFFGLFIFYIKIIDTNFLYDEINRSKEILIGNGWNSESIDTFILRLKIIYFIGMFLSPFFEILPFAFVLAFIFNRKETSYFA